MRVTCLNANDNTLLFSDTVREGDEVGMNSLDGDRLPEQVRCSLFNQIGELLQSLVINMSWNDDLNLKDQFGSLVLSSCNSQECIKEVSYTYAVENTGSTAVVVTRFERMRNGERGPLLPRQTPFDLMPGDAGTTTESRTIDLCAGESCV